MDSYRGMVGNHASKTFDILLELAPSGTSLSGETEPVFLGSGLVDADLVIDVAKASSGDALALEFCDAQDFASDTVAGPTVPLPETGGRVIAPFRNDPQGTPLSYVRLKVTGTPTAGAFIGKK